MAQTNVEGSFFDLKHVTVSSCTLM